MPDSEGKLTGEERQIIVEWFKNKTGKDACPSCLSTAWALMDYLIDLRVYLGVNSVFGGPTFPAVSLVCQECGYFRFYSAILIGVVVQEDREEENVEQSS